MATFSEFFFNFYPSNLKKKEFYATEVALLMVWAGSGARFSYARGVSSETFSRELEQRAFSPASTSRRAMRRATADGEREKNCQGLGNRTNCDD